MKTKQIPAVVMLLAGFITCIVAIFQGIELVRFLKILLLVLICFYVAGCVIKVILDKNFKEIEEDEEEKVTNEEEPKEQETEKESESEGQEEE